MKKSLTLMVTIVLILSVPYAISAGFWASKHSNKSHYPDCVWAQKIKPSNLIIFRTPEEAQRDSYFPCKVCTPPLFSKGELKNGEILVAVKLHREAKQMHVLCSEQKSARS